MSVYAFVFPGQGSQSVGMGRDLAAAFAAAREVFQEVDDILEQKLAKLMFEGPGEDLQLTENTQPALMAMSMAVLRVLGRRVPVGLKVFLTALAIIDDLGAILVIALFYTKGLNLWDLGGAALVWLGLLGLNRAGVRSLWPYLAGGAALWLLVFQSIGELVSRGLSLPLPGPVLGLILLLIALQFPLVRESVGACANFLLSHLSLLFVPVGVGVMTHLSLLSQYGGRMLLVIAVSTWIGLTVTALVFYWPDRRSTSGPPDLAEPAQASSAVKASES